MLKPTNTQMSKPTKMKMKTQFFFFKQGKGEDLESTIAGTRGLHCMLFIFCFFFPFTLYFSSSSPVCFFFLGFPFPHSLSFFPLKPSFLPPTIFFYFFLQREAPPKKKNFHYHVLMLKTWECGCVRDHMSPTFFLFFFYFFYF